jgi:hypothetical protein
MNNEMISINPKYKNIIDYRLNDADSKRTFMFLVNLAIKTITQYDEISDFERFMYRKNADGKFYAIGTSTKGIYNIYEIRVAGQTMMKYVRAGLMEQKKDNGCNRYFFPYDFFITNDLSIKFVVPANIVF